MRSAGAGRRPLAVGQRAAGLLPGHFGRRCHRVPAGEVRQNPAVRSYGRSNPPPAALVRNASHWAEVKTNAGPVGFLESRTPTMSLSRCAIHNEVPHVYWPRIRNRESPRQLTLPMGHPARSRSIVAGWCGPGLGSGCSQHSIRKRSEGRQAAEGDRVGVTRCARRRRGYPSSC